MDPLRIEATQRSPRIDFDFGAGRLEIAGEIYPEDASRFFGPVLERLETYLSGLEEAEVEVRFTLQYFNSSSAKALMNMLRLFDRAAAAGNVVDIKWYCYEDDDTIYEAGEDLSEDLDHASFEVITTELS